MKGHTLIQSAATVVACLAGWLVAAGCQAADGEDQISFRSVLELAGLDPNALGKLPDTPDFNHDHWQLLLQTRHRLRQFSAAGHQNTALAWDDHPPPETGALRIVSGVAQSVKALPIPEELARAHELSVLYRCRFRFDSSGTDGIVLLSHVPKSWLKTGVNQEPISFRGVLLSSSSDTEPTVPIFLADRLSWYPRDGVTSGQLLLARNGVDVALLDEVAHRQPFVRSDLSREGEAFYACLAFMRRADANELAALAKENVARVAVKWKSSLDRLGQQLGDLHAQIDASTDELQRVRLTTELEATRRRRAMAIAVVQRGKMGLSSVAPLFLQPEQETGELVRIEGTARRAMRVFAEEGEAIEAYYEIEVFPPDSQNLPVVCCLIRLPENFPIGDEIREPVRVCGLFFKSWLYRTRESTAVQGEPATQKRLYSPVILGVAPTWLDHGVARQTRWELWAGMAFLAVLAAVWLNMMWLARRDRQIRLAANGRPDLSDL